MSTIRTTALSIAFLLALELNVTPAAPGQDIPTDFVAGVQLAEGSEEAGQLVDWAAARFEAAGLELPPVEVRVHADKAPCDGHLGLTLNTPDRVTLHLCTPGDGRGVVDRLTLVHELAHAWVAENVDPAQRDRFMKVHGLEAWWDATKGWERQGVEWAAETIAWAVFDEGVRMIGEVDDDPVAVRDGYQVLAGETALNLLSHDHNLASRASQLDDRPSSALTDVGSLMNLESLTLDELSDGWNSAVERRDLPAGLPRWQPTEKSALATIEVTEAVELLAITEPAGTVTAVTLIGTATGQCESYDTLLAWALLLEALQPEAADAIDSGQFDSALIERHGQLRGIVHLP